MVKLERKIEGGVPVRFCNVDKTGSRCGTAVGVKRRGETIRRKSKGLGWKKKCARGLSGFWFIQTPKAYIEGGSKFHCEQQE